MPTKVWKDKNRCTITEFMVNSINEFGDTCDTDGYETEQEAVSWADSQVGEDHALLDFEDPVENAEYTPVAWEVEKVVRKYPAHRFSEPTTYETLHTCGDETALKAGGWIE